MIFIATKTSIQSELCIELVQYTRELNIPIISLVIEDIRGIDSIVLNEIDHNFEVYKDRVYDTGYDPCILLGEEFQKFIDHINQVLDKTADITKNHVIIVYFHIP